VSALGSAVLVGVYLVEVRRYGSTGPSNEPLAEREQQMLARADQRRALRAFALLVVGAVFALAIKVLLGASWPTAIIMFVVVTVFYWFQYTRRIAHLRRRREIELAQVCNIDSTLTLPDSQSTF
jgi:Flp pilus assembly protein TadB